ncbi:MAG: hypothetical protein M1819_006315 [Sarea resinae]|nr:MAG: hypothetical protein M1819_006315 [Sarea resinae]
MPHWPKETLRRQTKRSIVIRGKLQGLRLSNSADIVVGAMFEGLGEVFAVPAVYEYAFNKAPTNMRSMVQAVYVLCAAVGDLIALALNPTYKDPDLLYMYDHRSGYDGSDVSASASRTRGMRTRRRR